MKTRKPRTKTAALITKIQHQNQEEAFPPQQHSLKKQVINARIPNIQHYNLYRISIKPESSSGSALKLSASNQQCKVCSELQRQNFRLIQSNYNILVRHANIIDKVKEYLKKVIIFIQEYHYVHAIQTIYEALEYIRQYKQIKGQQQKVSGIEVEKLDDSIPQRAYSMVQQYQQKPIQSIARQQFITEQYQPKPIQSIKKQQFFQIMQTVREQYRPPISEDFPHCQQISSIYTPYFNKQHRLTQPNDKVNSSMPILDKSLEYRSDSKSNHRIYSSKNIQFLKGNKKLGCSLLKNEERLEDIHRLLLIQAECIESTLYDPSL